MIKKLSLLFLTVIAIILEALPFGAVLNFANPDGEPWRKTFSYFSLTPFGYANFAPLLTALLTCILLVLVIVSLFLKKSVKIPLICISILATVLSLIPLCQGTNYFSIVGALIFFVLLFFTAVCFFSERKNK